MSNPRQKAAEILQTVIGGQLFYSDVKNETASCRPEDTAFINMLVLTSLRRLTVLRQILSALVKKKMKPGVEFLLLTAAAELLFMDTPAYAVINCYVELAKNNYDRYTANFMNAVLRRIERDRQSFLSPKQPFFSRNFRRLLEHSYAPAVCEDIEAAAAAEPPLDITVKKDAESWAEKLHGKKMFNNSVRLNRVEGKIKDLPGFADGEWWIQDLAASLPVQLLGDVSGLKVLDLCAAPGGKTAQLLTAGARVTALDISDSRLDILNENLRRLRLVPEEIICADALDFMQNYKGDLFDVVVMDAPCSATGTLRRHPEIVHLKTLADVERQAEIQRRFLSGVSRILIPGGRLLYCVCSLTKTEGERQISRFLEKNSNFRLLPVENFDCPELITPEGFLRTLPSHLSEDGGLDGFFAAVLQKVD